MSEIKIRSPMNFKITPCLWFDDQAALQRAFDG